MPHPGHHLARISIALLAALTSPLEAQARATASLEAGIVDELNRVRTNPAAYAAHLEALLQRFDGKVLRSRQGLVETEEGAAAVREAIAALRATAPVGRLRRSRGLDAAARDLVGDQGTNGGIGHAGSDGSTPAGRADRHGRWGGALSENITYSAYPGVSARDVVIQLLVDDGVPGRGHRTNLLDPGMRRVGVACGSHPGMALVCVMDHAQEYEEGG